MACSLALGLTMIGGYYRELTSSNDNLSRLKALRNVMNAANRITAERGPANSVLRDPPTSNGPSLERLRQFRGASDDALAQVAAIPALAQATVEPTRALAAGRAEIDALARRPLEMRSDVELQAAIDAMFEAYDATQILVDTAMTTLLREHDPEVAGRALVARMLTELRDHAGRLSSLLVVPLVYRQPLNLERRARFEATRGRVLELWLLIRQQTAGSNYAEVAAAHAAVTERFFREGMALLDKVLAASQLGHFEISSTTLSAALIPTFAPLEQLREAYLTAAVTHFKADRAAALRALWMVSGGTAILILIELLLLILGQRLLFRPLLAARSRIIALADGEIGKPALGISAKGEMRGLFDALEVLRGRLIERDALDRERAALTASLKRQADLDGLTGVLNRGALERLAAELASNTAPAWIGLILLDLDHFKAVNDRFGHAVGDEVLKEVARRLRVGVRSNDAVARFGGEEFAILLHDIGREPPVDIAGRLRNALQSAPIAFGDGEAIAVTASFGVAVSANRPRAWADLVSSADRALYAAKAAGRNRVVDDGVAA